MSQFELKKLSREAIPKALERAMRYRLLNDPALAESICIDVLETDPDNQDALSILILALTDQCSAPVYCVGHNRVEDFLERLTDEYKRHYYTGLYHERKAKATLAKRMAGTTAYQLFRDLFRCYIIPLDDRISQILVLCHISSFRF